MEAHIVPAPQARPCTAFVGHQALELVLVDLEAAQLLAPGGDRPSRDAESLPAALIALMKDIEIPNGVAAVGYTDGDIPDLVEGAMKQQRLLATCPKPVTEDDIAGVFSRSMELW